MAEVRLSHVSKQFGDVVAVNDVNLTVKDREFVVLVGPSGCGKSTTLRMIAGLEEISSGSLFIADKKVNDLAPKDRDIAMVFQSYALYPHMTVFENMAFGLRLQRLPKSEIQTRVMDAAKVLGLVELLERKPREMSGGQRQRVAMGRAIVRRPAVFLFDEPLSNLDARLRVQMRTEIARLHRQLDTTSVYVTHDQVEAMTLADRIVVMNEGKVQQVGSPMELYHRPSNLFVATFIGSPSMNLLSSELTREDEQFKLQADGLAVTLSPAWKNILLEKELNQLVFGLRPQHIKIEENTTQADVPQATLEVMEPLGAETFYYFRVDKQEQMVVVRENTDTLRKVGETYGLSFRQEALQLFDKQSGEALPHPHKTDA